MTILFAGTSNADLVFHANKIEGNSGSLAPYVNIGCQMTSNTEHLDPPDFAPITEVHTSFYHYVNVAASTIANFFLVKKATGDLNIGRINVTSKKCLIQVWRSGAWVTLATSTVDLINGLVSRFDISAKYAAVDGFVEVWMNGVLLVSYTGNTSSDNGPDVSRVSYGGANTYTVSMSAFIISTESTKTLTLVERRPSGNGALAEWTGSYADIDEITASDTDFITPTALNQISTFTFPALPAPLAGYEVQAVVQSARGQLGGASPTSFESVARVSGTNYEQAIGSPIPSTFGGGLQSIWSVNPATGLTWTQAEVEAAQFGYKATA